jgi:hypothetical protein
VQRVLFPYLEGTGPRYTEGVARGVARIPTPFVREMVVQELVQEARAEGEDLLSVEHWVNHILESQRLFTA